MFEEQLRRYRRLNKRDLCDSSSQVLTSLQDSHHSGAAHSPPVARRCIVSCWTRHLQLRIVRVEMRLTSGVRRGLAQVSDFRRWRKVCIPLGPLASQSKLFNTASSFPPTSADTVPQFMQYDLDRTVTMAFCDASSAILSNM